MISVWAYTKNFKIVEVKVDLTVLPIIIKMKSSYKITE